MAFIPAKCSECGSNIKVDDTKKNGVCEYCGTEFITEKIINNQITEIKNQTNIYIDNKTPEEEKQCKLLLMMLENFDIKNIEERALKVLDANPNNELASMIYNCKFSITSFLEGQFSFVNFNEKVVQDYFVNNHGNVSFDLSFLFIKYLLLESKITLEMTSLLDSILSNINSLDIDLNEIQSLYMTISFAVNDNTRIDQIKKIASKSKSAAWLNIFVTGNAAISTAADLEHDKAKQLVDVLTKQQECFKEVIINNLNKSSLDKEVKDKIIETLNNSENQDEKETRQGCYIATCVYGSYDCPQVWMLRRYRDNKLSLTWYGKAFIKIYYKISPALVRIFGKTKWFKRLWKNYLDKKIKKLEKAGYESTPYKDKDWN